MLGMLFMVLCIICGVFVIIGWGELLTGGDDVYVLLIGVIGYIILFVSAFRVKDENGNNNSIPK